jgi:hypothetical protein
MRDRFIEQMENLASFLSSVTELGRGGIDLTPLVRHF